MTNIVSDVEVTEVRAAHRFDEGALAEYLKQNVDGFSGDLTVRQFDGGQSNTTYWLEAGGTKYVLRKKPPGKLLKSAHQIDREYMFMKALADTDVPVPRMLALCEDDSIIGTDFYVMEHVEGRVLIDPSLPSMSNSDRCAAYEHFIHVLAKLHLVDYEQVGLGQFARPGDYYDRQISRWSKQYEASATEKIQEMDDLIKWLPDNIPTDSDTSIAHGDYRFGNVILHPTKPEVIAVLDWELATIGHPLADLSYCGQEYYFHKGAGGIANVDPTTLGIPSVDDFIGQYCKATKRDKIDNWPFYIAYNLFRSAAIVQGVYKRGLDGNAASDQALTFKHVCRDRAVAAWKILQDAGLV